MTPHDARPASPGATDLFRSPVDEAALVRRLEFCRRRFDGCAMSFPAEILSVGAAGEWLRRHNACVTVHNVQQLTAAVAQGISPARLTLHSAVAGASARAAVEAGVGRFVVSNAEDLATLGDGTGRRIRLLIDHDADLTELLPVIAASRRLEVAGIQHRIAEDSGDPLGLQAVREAIGDMAWVRRAYGVLLPRICIDGLHLGTWTNVPSVLRKVAEALSDCVGAACEQHRYPRPMLSVTPTATSLTG